MSDPFGMGVGQEQPFRKYHNFTRLRKFNNRIPSFSKPIDPTKGKWWCNYCDSVVVYPATYTDGDVNRRVFEVNKLKCIQPVVTYNQ